MMGNGGTVISVIHRAGRTVLIFLALLSLAFMGTGVALKIQQDNAHDARQEVQAKRAAAEKAARDVALAAQQAETERQVAARQAEIERQVEAQQAETERQVEERLGSEREMQKSITKWARELVSDGTLNGPILRTSCTPIGGGSQDLSEVTVKYECLAITNDNSDGTSTGYGVEATMNFSTGEYQWGLD